MDSNVIERPVLVALRLSEERAAEGYLTARREMVRLASRVASIRQLVTERPMRADYRAALRDAQAAHGAAVQRTGLAYQRWHRAQLRSDAHWTDTAGRAA
ncbi:hypothetical protein GCM10027445_50590 [Amycolatopsis endophytica]|uniref:Uncharacterized protein n=1 Tax=Amycolatopsis endophytica TaxID=860233 RepID=A0A853AZ17_9PSEU|nr:hypothetical protein [Amycolatopsis endophytica]NYI87867.1 hypothetical protein [Amycolatopsis endophytica]